jgi:hypothetical protein
MNCPNSALHPTAYRFAGTTTDNYRTPTIYISPQTNPQQHIRGVMNDSVERGAFEPVFLSVYDGFTLNFIAGHKAVRRLSQRP